MPIISFAFEESKGVIIPVYVAKGATGEGEEAASLASHDAVHAVALIDTGAYKTCISTRLAEKMKLEPSGKGIMVGVTGAAEMSTYFLDIVIPMDEHQYACRGEVSSFYLEEDAGFEILLGRDIICRGMFQLDRDGRAMLAF